MKPTTTSGVRYIPATHLNPTRSEKSIEVIGLDTEALKSGKCFMICTSEGDIINPAHFPEALFNRRYIGKKFVTYNLKYDSGALLQNLPKNCLNLLRTIGRCEYKGYTYRMIANKLLSIRKGKNTVHIYDIAKFYECKLETAASKYLNKHKIDIETKTFTIEYVKANFKRIAEYCIYDAVLCKELADILINSFKKLGIHPKKLYSQAYISWQYVKDNCKWIHVKRLWNYNREVLDFAMLSYNGGKFEVTRKGCDYYYEYDIVSAYPYQIANLIDISDAAIGQSKTYQKDAVYGFIDADINIPHDVYSPVALKRGMLNYYPTGSFRKVITKAEYEYLIRHKCDINVRKAYWMFVDNISYPYRDAIMQLMKLKDLYKQLRDDSMYNVTKKILNAIYGKMVQLIKQGKYWRAGSSWNPVYGSVITANTRIKISQMQMQYPEVVAVHTDSIISTRPLPFKKDGKLGDMTYEIEGDGVILGTGIYQVGKKSKMRGFEVDTPLLDILPRSGKVLKTKKVRPLSWREVVYRNMSLNKINRFVLNKHDLNLNFDAKRIWLDDYKHFGEVRKRCVQSIAWDEEIASYR
jgi:hypothetical protein